MDPTVIELRVADPAALHAWWLEGLPHGGIFVPSGHRSAPLPDHHVAPLPDHHVAPLPDHHVAPLPDLDLFAGAAVRLCIVIEGNPVGSTLIDGTVIHRRTSAGASAAPPAMRRPSLLQPGVGIAFDEGTERRSSYLIERSRGFSKEVRNGLRWPVGIGAHVVLRDGQRPVRVSLEDVGTRGARISLPPGVVPDRGTQATLAIRSTEFEVTSAFLGAIAWTNDRSLGLTFALDTKEERARWARLVTRAREAFERRRVAALRL